MTLALTLTRPACSSMRTPSSTARWAGRACRWRCLRRRVQPPGGSERRGGADCGAADLCKNQKTRAATPRNVRL
eukprot:scaffold39771_cov56-Phaeocystis_antarctica.AAC.1